MRNTLAMENPSVHTIVNAARTSACATGRLQRSPCLLVTGEPAPALQSPFMGRIPLPARKRRKAVTRTARYLISLPERLFRSGAALAGGLIRQLGDVTLPAAVRRTKTYQTMVDIALRFMIEQIGQVEGVYPSSGSWRIIF